VRDISVSQQQRVEILKALYRGARTLILDEPTALLTPQERQGLFEAVGRLQQSGVAVLFITHKLDEADRLADDITVMRLGRVVARHRVGKVTHQQLIIDMVGRSEVGLSRPERTPGEGVIALDHVTADSDAAYPLHPTTLEVRRGEVLAVIGIDGHGHQTLCQVLAGVRPTTGGSLTVHGRRPARWRRARAMSLGVSYVPEDRLAAGVAREESIADNLIANRLRNSRFVRGGLINRAQRRAYADELIERFDIRCRDRDQTAGSLSGGNVQKVVLAREIAVDPAVLVVCEPTRGLDIGAIQNVHTQISRAADAGAAVVMQSSDLDEVVEVADRIVVFREGAIVADLPNGPDVTIEALGARMLGTREDADA
jgi:simple sugar transport system ATP-binding protein